MKTQMNFTSAVSGRWLTLCFHGSLQDTWYRAIEFNALSFCALRPSESVFFSDFSSGSLGTLAHNQSFTKGIATWENPKIRILSENL